MSWMPLSVGLGHENAFTVRSKGFPENHPSSLVSVLVWFCQLLLAVYPLYLTEAFHFKFSSRRRIICKRNLWKKQNIIILFTVAARLSCLLAEADMPVCGWSFRSGFSLPRCFCLVWCGRESQKKNMARQIKEDGKWPCEGPSYTSFNRGEKETVCPFWELWKNDAFVLWSLYFGNNVVEKLLIYNPTCYSAVKSV